MYVCIYVCVALPANEEEDGHGQEAEHLDVLPTNTIDEEDGQPIARNAYTVHICMYVCMYVCVSWYI